MLSIVLRYWSFGGRYFSPEVERIISRRRIAALIAIAVMVAIAAAGGTGPRYFYALILALWAVAAGFAAAQTIRLHRHDTSAPRPLDAWVHPVFAVLALAFFVATLPNQVNAVAYLTGQHS